MKSNPKAVFLILICTILTSTAEIFLKKGSLLLEPNLLLIIKNTNLILGIFFYGLAFIILVIALKFADLSYAYPLLALSYVIVYFLSYLFLNESFTLLKTIGTFFVLLGVTTISIGGK